MGTAIKTSLAENRSPEVFRGLSWYSTKVALAGLIAGGMLASMFKNLPILPLVFIIATPIVSFIAAQKVIGGKWEFEGWERLYGRIKSFFSAKAVDLEKRAGMMIKEEKKGPILRGDNLNEIEGYEITEYKDMDLLLLKCKDLITNLPEGNRIYFVRLSLPIETERLSLKKAKIFKNYIFVEYGESILAKTRLQDEIRRTLDKAADPMDAKKSAEIIKKMIQPNVVTFAFEEQKFLREINIDIKNELASFGEISQRAMALTMAEMPEMISSEFQKIYGVINSCCGAISVAFASTGGVNVIGEALYERTLKHFGQKREDPGRANRINLTMTVAAVVHGSEAELSDLLYDIEREYSFLEQNQRPKFKRESHFLKEAILLMIPGQGPVMDFRSKKVVNSAEALLYIPLPKDAGKEANFLKLRTECNSIYNFSLQYDKPLYIWGGVGEGKSALMSLFILTHIKKGNTASFALEAGGTFSFLREGLADVSIILEQDGDSKWLPLEDHPLRALLFYGDSGIGAATEWIMGLAEVHDEQKEIRRNISKSLKEMQESGICRLKDFCKIFAERLEKDNITSKESLIAIKNIANFAATDDSMYGYIFDPEKTKNIDYSKARHFYISQLEVSQEAQNLLAAFFNYGMQLLKALEKRFATKGVVPCDLLVSIDELNHLIKNDFISWDEVRDLNSQGRKQGKIINCASQSLSDVVSGGKRDPYEFLQAFPHYLFSSGVANVDHLIRALRVTEADLEQKIRQEFQLTVDAIAIIRRRGKGYAWGYVDKERGFRILLIDLEKEEQWAITSHKTARLLLAETIAVNQCSYWRACKLLALYGPGDLPVANGIPEQQKELMFHEMRKHTWGSDIDERA